MNDRMVVVLAGGDALSDTWEFGRALDGRTPSSVIAADSGLAHAGRLGLDVDLIVGDFDSADPALVDAAVAGGARAERHPAEKDHTDLELALLAARDAGASEIIVIGGHGGRLDHLLANALALTADALASIPVRAHFDDATITVVRDERELRGAPGSLLTLLAVGGPATGVRTHGLRYPLAGETLHPGSSRGVSNEFSEPVARVAVTAGVLLAIQPQGS